MIFGRIFYHCKILITYMDMGHRQAGAQLSYRSVRGWVHPRAQPCTPKASLESPISPSHETHKKPTHPQGEHGPAGWRIYINQWKLALFILVKSAYTCTSESKDLITNNSVQDSVKRASPTGPLMRIVVLTSVWWSSCGVRFLGISAEASCFFFLDVMLVYC